MVEGVCNNGKKETIFIKESTCANGVVYNTIVEKCGPEIQFPYWIFIIFLILFIIFCIGFVIISTILFIVVRRFRKLKSDYVDLVERNDQTNQDL
jgi:large-conductance mechanosensitive channel